MEKYIYDKKNIITGIIIKTVAIVSAIYGLCMGIRESQDITYFTNLSNILIAMVLLWFLIMDIIILKSQGSKNIKKNYMFIIKFALTLCISLTWLIYMCILAPTSNEGFFMSYANHNYGSLCLHFITPVLAILDFIFIDYNYESRGIHAIYAIIPPLVYVGFVVCLALSGMRWEGDMWAPYNFLNFGADTGWFGFDLSQMSSTSLGIGVAYMIVALVLIFIGIGRLFLLFGSLRRKAVIKIKDNN